MSKSRDSISLIREISDREDFCGNIGVASRYVSRLFQPDGYDTLVKELSRKLVYSGDGMTFVRKFADLPSVQELKDKFGPDSAEYKAVSADLSPLACMDFEAIITSTKQDRDGDVLESKGATIDPRCPLLWQHNPNNVIGKLVGVTGRDDTRIKGRLSIADTLQGRDAAYLVEFGALRISHGFKPYKFDQLPPDTTGMMPGYHVQRWKMFEVSLVSVPSNDDAIITAFSRQKLHDPAVKEWAKSLNDTRSKMVVGGYNKNAKETPMETKAMRLTKARTKCLKHAQNMLSASMDHDEMGQASMCKSLLQAAHGKIGSAMSKDDGEEKSLRMTGTRTKMLADAQEAMMQAHDHDEMKDAAHCKSLVKGAHGYVTKAMTAPVKDDDGDGDEDGSELESSEANPGMDYDPMEANPGIRSLDVTATKFLSAVIVGDVDWQTLHEAKGIIDGAIERAEAKAMQVA